MTTVDIVKAAAATLDEALALDWPELVVSDRAKLWLLGQVWGESRFGSTPDWGTSNNWGAVTYYKKDGKYLEHADHDAAGNPVVYRFQAYDSQLDAARGWLHVLLQGKADVLAALAGDSSYALAAAMKAHGYYTGINVDTDGDGVPGTTHDRILAYTQLIDTNAAFVAAKLAIPDGAPDLESVDGYQDALKRLGFYDGAVDGIAGPKTKAAVLAFQGQSHLKPDGFVGPLTQAAILEALRLLDAQAAETLREPPSFVEDDGGAARHDATGDVVDELAADDLTPKGEP